MNNEIGQRFFHQKKRAEERCVEVTEASFSNR
jgi:hypothetical protein